MSDGVLLQKGGAAIDGGEYYEALACFLKVREEGLDLVYAWQFPRSVSKIQLRDINFDACMEIGALSTDGQLSFYSLQSSPAKICDFTDSRVVLFRFFRDIADRPGVLVLRPNNVLGVYEFAARGTATYLKRIRNVPLPRGAGQVLDLAYKPNSIYVTFSSGRIYEYAKANFDLRVHTTNCVVQRLKTGGRLAEDPASVAHRCLLGVLRDGGLVIFDIRLGELREARKVASDEIYADAFLGDADNDGIDDIIAITQDGKLHVFDWYSLRLKFFLSLSDEFYCLYCEDIDNDGVLEMLVGARSNRIYSFAISSERGLYVKKQYETGHRVMDMWAGDVKKDDKRVIVGKADGKLEVFRVYPAREINRYISDAFRELCGSSPTGLEMQLATSDHIEVLRFGLEQLAPQMTASDLIRFLAAVGEKGGYTAELLIASSLPRYLKKLQNEQLLAEYAVGFFVSLFKSHHDLRTCQQICSALNQIVSQGVGVSIELLELYDNFNRERLRMEGAWPQRVDLIRDQIDEGKLSDAYAELVTLRETELDLVKYIRTTEAVSFVGFHSSRVILTTANRWFKIIDLEREEEIVSRQFPEIKLHCCGSPAEAYACFVSHGQTLEIYDQQCLLAGIRTYDSTVHSLGAFSRNTDVYWIVGCDDGQIFLEGPANAQTSFSVPAFPVGIASLTRKDLLDLYVLTVDCKMYIVRDIIRFVTADGQSRQQLPAASLELFTSGPLNALAWIPLQGNSDGVRFVILCPDGLVVVTESGNVLHASIIPLGRSLTCSTVYRNEDGGSFEIIVGTRDRSLLFLSLKGQIRKEVYLPDVPTSMHMTTSDGSSKLFVGFASGNIGCYQLLSHKFLSDLEDRCDRRKEEHRLSVWTTHDLKEKLALITLARTGRLELAEIHAKVEKKIRLLVPQEKVVDAVKSLEQKGVIRGEIEGATVRFAFRDKLYADWVRSRQDIYKTVREHRDEAMGAISLADIHQIDSALSDERGKQWLADFLLVDHRKYNRLVEMSLLMGHRTAAPADQRESLRRNQVQLLSDLLEAVFLKGIGVGPELNPDLSAFEIKIPAVKFQGFDRILVTVLSTQQAVHARVLTWISGLSDWKVVLVLLSRHGDLVRDALKNVPFNMAVLDDEDLKAILLADAPRQVFLDLLLAQIDLATLSPFQCYGPVTKTFYGRSQERQKIVNSMQGLDKLNYAVIGPRKIGKTSLLLRTQKDIDSVSSLRATYLDLSPYKDTTTALQAILRALQIAGDYSSPDQFIRQIDTYRREQKRQPVLLIDEVDGVLHSDQRVGGGFSEILRTLTNQVGVRVVIAGYKVIYHQMHNISSVMFNTFTPLELGELDKGDAMALVEESFRNVIHIERSDMLHILEQTAYYPNFIQFCCHLLLAESPVRTLRTIERSDINRVLSSPELYDHMARVYIEGLDQQCKVLVYLMVASYDDRLGSIVTDPQAYHEAIRSSHVRKRERYKLGPIFTPYDLHRLLELHNVRLTDDELLVLMRRLALASVFKHGEGKNYSFVLPHLPQILAANAEVELAATNLLERVEEIFRKTG